MGINNPHHYTNYSDECAKEWGVNCDGTIYDDWDLPVVECDCSCHGFRAPIFVTVEDVESYHGKDE